MMMRKRGALLHEELRHLGSAMEEGKIGADRLHQRLERIEREIEHAIHLCRQFLQTALNCREEELILGWEVAIDRAITHADVIGDRLDLGARKAMRREDARRHLKYLGSAACFKLGIARPTRPWLWIGPALDRLRRHCSPPRDLIINGLVRPPKYTLCEKNDKRNAGVFK